VPLSLTTWGAARAEWALCGDNGCGCHSSSLAAAKPSGLLTSGCPAGTITVLRFGREVGYALKKIPIAWKVYS
jgi:hypothetical protein